MMRDWRIQYRAEVGGKWVKRSRIVSAATIVEAINAFNGGFTGGRGVFVFKVGVVCHKKQRGC